MFVQKPYHLTPDYISFLITHSHCPLSPSRTFAPVHWIYLCKTPLITLFCFKTPDVFPLPRVNLKFFSLAGKALHNMSSAYLRSYFPHLAPWILCSGQIGHFTDPKTCLLCPFLHVPQILFIAKSNPLPERTYYSILRLLVFLFVPASPDPTLVGDYSGLGLG